MKRNGRGFMRAITLALALLGSVLAQVPSPPGLSTQSNVAGVVFSGSGDAAGVLARALAVQGLAAPDSLQTALFTLEAHFLDVDGPEATEVDRILYDIPGARAATMDNIGLPDEAQAVVTPTAAYFASKGTGVLTVPRKEVYKWHSPFDLGPAGLALARTPGATVELAGQDVWDITEGQKRTGDVLRLRLHNHSVDYLLDSAGRVQAVRSFQDVDDEDGLIIVPTAWENIGPVNWMVQGQIYYAGEQVGTARYRDIQLNAPAPDTYPLRNFTLTGTPTDLPRLHSNVAPEPASVTAQDILDEAIFNVARRYGGLARINPSTWPGDLQPRLNSLCSAQAACPPATATPVIRELLGRVADPHMSFQPAARVAREKPGVALHLGLEVLLATDGAVVRQVTSGTPAAQAGFQVGDIITQINGARVTPYSYYKQLPEEARLTTFTVLRQGQPVSLRLTPSREEPTPVQYTLRPDGIGVVRIDNFEQSGTGQKVHDAVRKAMTDQVKGLILDLRWNPGGQLTEFLLSAGAFTQPSTLWLKQPAVRRNFTYQNGLLKVGNIEYTSIKNPVRYSGPLAVLVNESSASGAEFLARELQGRPRTATLGSKTVGVGNTAVRRVVLSDGSELRITMSVVQDEQGNLLAPTVTPQVASTLNFRRLVTAGQDSMIEDAARALEDVR
ncbi:S41 family peptidase [Deinococcus fonticola]|uniref:S41 family peptidase n=1 Tax=Deinococcus fonticola TaxID=2528713 RepID=UPI001431674E|nr:S41 family peptidase [Deinococcus fonticola]